MHEKCLSRELHVLTWPIRNTAYTFLLSNIPGEKGIGIKTLRDTYLAGTVVEGGVDEGHDGRLDADLDLVVAALAVKVNYQHLHKHTTQ